MQRFSHKACSVLELKIFKGFSHTNAYKCIGSKLDLAVKRSDVNVLLAILVDLSSPMIPAKVQPQDILGSGGEDFLKVFTIYGRGGHLGQRTATILAIFRSPTLRRLHMKFEQNWLSGFRGEVV